MIPFPYNAKRMKPAVLIGTDGTEYIGEYLDRRVTRSTLPKGKYAYDCRHSENGDWVTPITIETHVLANFAGTFVTTTPIKFPDEDHPCINLESWKLL